MSQFYSETSRLILNWQRVGEALGMEDEFVELQEKFGEAPEGHWAIYMPRGLTLVRVGLAFNDRGSRILVNDQDFHKNIIRNARDPNRDGSYAVKVKARLKDYD